MLRSFIRGFRDVALLLARIAIGAILIARGWYRWQVSGVGQQQDILQQADLPATQALAWLVTAFELAGGVLLVFGLGTPLVGLGMLVLNGGVAWFRKWDNGLYQHEGGYEYSLTLAAIGLLFLAFGSGRLGVDNLFRVPGERRAKVDTTHAPPPPPPPAPEQTEETVFHRKPTANP